MGNRALASLFFVVLAFVVFERAANAGEGVIPPSRGPAVVALLADVKFAADAGDGYAFDSISIDRDRIDVVLKRRDRVVGTMKLVPIDEAASGDPVTKSFAVKLHVEGDDRGAADALRAAARSVAAHDDGGFYVSPSLAPHADALDQDPHATRRRSISRGPLDLAAIGAIVFALGVLALRRAGVRVETDLKIVHVIPAFVQTAIFAYWALYWRPLIDYFPLIAVQLVFAFFFDALLSLATRRRIVLGFAPVPIVLSINLFVQFPLDILYLSLAAIAIAFLSKVFIRRKAKGYEGHVFNPSAFGVTLVAFVHLALPWLGNGDNALRFALPPNMTELIFLVALFPQTRRPIVLVSFFTVLAMLWYRRLTGFNYFHPLWAPVFLSITLLGTDPATISRTGPGRVIFGFLLGLGFEIAATLLDKTGHSDFYGKVIALPFVNLIAPWCDRAGAIVFDRVKRALSPAANLAHMVAWAAFVLVVWRPEVKRGAFDPREHEMNQTPLIERDADGRITCADNRLFCDTFTFAREISAWAKR